MFDFIANNGMWKSMLRGIAPLKVYFSTAFINTLVRSPNFVGIVFSAVLLLIGYLIKKKIARWLCMFCGAVVGVICLVEFILVHY